MNTTIDPELDGVDHICLSPHGKTELGRALSIGAYRPFKDDVYGSFNSIMAFWGWLESNRDDALRELYHDDMIRTSLAVYHSVPGARSKVMQVLKRSVHQDPALCEQLANSHLPFLVYEVIEYSNAGRKVYPLAKQEWYAHALEEVRKELKT